MTALLLAMTAAAGVHLLVTAWLRRTRTPQGRGGGTGDRTGELVSTRRPRAVARLRSRAADWLVQAGLAGLRPSEFVGVSIGLCLLGGLVAFALFGGLVPSVVAAVGAAAVPLHLYRARRAARLARAQEAWPRLIEEIRVHALTLGRSLPQALFEAGRRAPEELRPAFEAAEREWLLSFDFGRTLDVLRSLLADPTADIACETLLVAHEVGGTDLAPRLEALAEDRRHEADGRKDARAKQAGVRFARRFVLVVPAGMAVAGALIGGGRAAYASPTGQVIVLVAFALVGVCWAWAGRYLRLPTTARLFGGRYAAAGADGPQPTAAPSPAVAA